MVTRVEYRSYRIWTAAPFFVSSSGIDTESQDLRTPQGRWTLVPSSHTYRASFEAVAAFCHRRHRSARKSHQDPSVGRRGCAQTHSTDLLFPPPMQASLEVALGVEESRKDREGDEEEQERKFDLRLRSLATPSLASPHTSSH